MPEGCTVRVDGKDLDKVEIGICLDTACQTLDGDTIETGYCGMIEQDALTVTCDSLIFSIQKITRCGCKSYGEGEQVKKQVEKNVVVIEGQIYLVTFEGDAQVRRQPWTEISFSVNGATHTSLPSGEFMFGTERTGDIMTLIFSAKASDSYMPHIATLLLIEGVTSYFVTVKLPPRPKPFSIHLAEGDYILSGSSHLDSALVISVPALSFVDANGVELEEEIDVFVSFMTQKMAIDLAAGDFKYIDEDGFPQRLVTYGVINMQAMTKAGEELQLSRDLDLYIDSEAVGISQGNIDDTCTWQIDEDTGFWRNCEPIAGGISRKKRQSNRDLTAVLKPGYRTYWNLDRVNFVELCEVLVVPYDLCVIEPQPGVQIEVQSILTGGGWSRDIRTTDADGKACAWVECGSYFEIFEQSGKYVPTSSHCLPETFNFKNELVDKIMHVYGETPTIATILGGLEGPVHVEGSKTCPDTHKAQLDFQCQVNNGTHHFQLQEKAKSQTSNSNNNCIDHPNFHDDRICYIRVKVEVSECDIQTLLH